MSKKILNEFLNPKYLDDTNYLLNKYKHNNPFPHIVLDNFINENILSEVANEFPSLDKALKVDYENNIFKKKAWNNVDEFPKKTRDLFFFLNSGSFVIWLNKVTGIKETLIPDPDFFGGGLHECFKGGFLKVHIDYHKHYKNHLDRRLNALIYLNKDWKDEYGGHLQLFDKNNLSKPAQKILPIFNRLVIFSTTDVSYHGHPDPLNCPINKSRKSIATWYYSNGRDDIKKNWLFKKNTTFWVNRDKRDNVKNLPVTLKDKLRKFKILRDLNKFLKRF